MLPSTEETIRNDVASCFISDILIYCMYVKCFMKFISDLSWAFFSDTNGTIINIFISEVITTMIYFSTASRIFYGKNSKYTTMRLV